MCTCGMGGFGRPCSGLAAPCCPAGRPGSSAPAARGAEQCVRACSMRQGRGSVNVCPHSPETRQARAAQVSEEEEEEMRVRMRQAQRKMRGVKLQYTDANRVTFDDVAGVGPAKACAPSMQHAAVLDPSCMPLSTRASLAVGMFFSCAAALPEEGWPCAAGAARRLLLPEASAHAATAACSPLPPAHQGGTSEKVAGIGG